MSSFRIRPRFKIEVNTSEAELIKLLKAELVDKENSCVGLVTGNFSVIKIPAQERHFWSPQLTLSYDERDEKTIIRGLYGPNPTVWAVFFFGYAILGIVALFILVVGFSRYSLDMSTTILWVLPGLGVGAVVLYIVAQTGQKFGAEHMYTLHHFFEDTIHKKVHIDVI